LFDYPKYTSKDEVCKIGSYPLDYNFLNNKPHYIIGMSVPPLMTGKIAEQIYKQWLSKIN
jgi:DNA (cytosine-5)-methyltransferase 1